MEGNRTGGDPIAAPDDASSGGAQWGLIERVLGAMKVYIASLISGENQRLGVLDTREAVEYWPSTFNGTASTARKTIGPLGSAGDILHGITIFNGSASNITAATLQDGSTTLAWVDLGALKTLAAGATATVMLPKGIQSQNSGGWGISITCAGTMSLVQIGAYGLF